MWYCRNFVYNGLFENQFQGIVVYTPTNAPLWEIPLQALYILWIFISYNPQVIRRKHQLNTMGTLLPGYTHPCPLRIPMTQTHRLEYEKPIPDKVVRSVSDGGSDDAVYGEVTEKG